MTTYYRCTGNGSGAHFDCHFHTTDSTEATEHFDAFGHDVHGSEDAIWCCPDCNDAAPCCDENPCCIHSGR